MNVIWTFSLIFLLFFVNCNDEAKAGELNQRLQKFPQWEKITELKPAVGDLFYPEWIKGEWEVKSTLIDLVAPLAPDILTPGFESNRQYLDRPVSFQVRFVEQKTLANISQKAQSKKKFLWDFSLGGHKPTEIVGDRAYNSLNLARTILGENTVKAVKVDPDSPNRQITFLRGERQLVSIVKSRATETTEDGRFITTEAFEQLFKGSSRPYLNSVESTTAYRKLSTSNPAIEANQVTAVYLSSQDPDYFKAANKPVALYRYKLEFFPVTTN